MFKLLAGLPELAQVPYRGAGPVMADLISGQVVMGMVALTSQSLEFHWSGKLRILAVTSPERLIAAPELPTVAEGSFPGLTNQSTIGPVAPAGTPKPIIEQIAQAVRMTLAEPGYQQKLIDSGFDASPDTTPEKFPASPRSRCCFLDAGGRGAWVEDRLTKAHQSCSLREIS
jgi:tripartite-type tricarboxylate transporter receptor subunit TctC